MGEATQQLTITQGSTCRHYTFNVFNAVPNYHPFWELVYVLRGEVTFSCGSHTRSLKAGDICAITPYTLHLFSECSDDADYLDFTLPDGFIEEDLLPTNSRFYCDSATEHLLYFRESMRMLDRRSWLNLAHHKRATVHFSKIVEMMFLELISTHLLDFVCEQQSEDISSIFKYVSENFCEELNMEMLSKRFFISQSYLSRMFKRYTGTSPIEAIIRCRMFNAAQMLITGTDNIKSIAQKCGYHSVTTFTKLFTNRLGCSPGEYRRRYADEGHSQTIYGPNDLLEKLVMHEVLD